MKIVSFFSEHSLLQQKRGVGEGGQMLTIADILVGYGQMLMFIEGGSKNSQKYVDVIEEWSLIQKSIENRLMGVWSWNSCA